MPVVYINTTLSDMVGNSISSENILNIGSREQFLAGETEMFLSDTLDFFNVQAALPARYRLLRIDEENINGVFKDLWSIGENRNNEKRAAERLLLFMLSAKAQDYLYIRNSSGILPLNRDNLNNFVEIYIDFDGFFENIDSYTFSTAQ